MSQKYSKKRKKSNKKLVKWTKKRGKRADFGFLRFDFGFISSLSSEIETPKSLIFLPSNAESQKLLIY